MYGFKRNFCKAILQNSSFVINQNNHYKIINFKNFLNYLPFKLFENKNKTVLQTKKYKKVQGN